MQKTVKIEYCCAQCLGNIVVSVSFDDDNKLFSDLWKSVGIYMHKFISEDRVSHKKINGKIPT